MVEQGKDKLASDLRKLQINYRVLISITSGQEQAEYMECWYALERAVRELESVVLVKGGE